ncbi:MAG: pilus assembly protein [Actinomycetota bacterium]|nr:pilus assembly protein [Actinomycetota bacterium]
MISFFSSKRWSAKSEDGVAATEFAVVLPLLLLIVLGIMDFGKAMNYWIDENHLASTGARWAAVNRNPGPGATLQQSIQQQADTSELRGATVCVSFPNGAAVGQPVQVTMRLDYEWLPYIANRLSIATTTISGTATMRLEAIPSTYEAGAGGTGTCA